MIRRAALTVALAAAVGITGCAVGVAGEPTSALKSPRTSPKPLPFTPTIKDRTNERTDGTTFEPCSAYTDEELRALSIDPATISDAANIDGPNYRGCHWQSLDYSKSSGKGIRYSQNVGNKLSLSDYKKKMSMLPWQTDRSVHGRTLAIAAESDYCLAVFASEFAIVGTSAAQPVNPTPDRAVECEKAVAFASLAITKAPE